MVVIQAPGYRYLFLNINEVLEINDTQVKGVVKIQMLRGFARYVRGKDIDTEIISNKLIFSEDRTGLVERIDAEHISNDPPKPNRF